jgi:hypothetical protein
MATQLTADALLASGSATHAVQIPLSLLRGGASGGGDEGDGTEKASGGEVTLRPLLVRDVDRVVRASREQRVLASVLMVQQSLVAPKMSVEQVGDLPAGVVQFLADRVNAISGLSMNEDELEQAVRAPLARACFILAREFGWTPAECSELTVGQVLLYLEMIAREDKTEAAS